MSSNMASDKLIFYVNGQKIVEKNADPEEMLVSYLRKKLRLTGTKVSCGGGGCGACTVMISTIHPVSKKILHYAATACLIPICSLYGRAVTTTEGIGNSTTRLHPVQERIAKAHGSQCGFCTPGMVMSMYSLLRNHPEPTMEDIYETLSGNLCRCTGYRPILDGCKTFVKNASCCQGEGREDCCMKEKENKQAASNKNTPKLFNEKDFLPYDVTQELIFPPELMLMLSGHGKQMVVFHGERITWFSPATLGELLELKAKYRKAPLVAGNTTVGPQMKFEGVFHPVIISPVRIPELYAVTTNDLGITIGAACSLNEVKRILSETVSHLPEDKTKIFRALTQQLSTLAGQQIRNMASVGGHIISKSSISDLNPILATGSAILNVASKTGTRQIPLNDKYFTGFGTSALKSEEILLSVLIPYSKKGQFVSAFKQAERLENANAIVNAGMSVLFKEGTDIIMKMAIFYGGIGSTTVYAKNTSHAFIGRQWDEKMLSEASRMVVEEVILPGSAPGGMVEYKRTLAISFLFKFYLQVSQEMNKPVTSLAKAPEYLSATREFEKEMPKTSQIFQEVNPSQPAEDPIGKPIVHQSGIKQATGEAVYVDDMPAVDRELFMAFVLSTRAHAKVLSIDVSEALKLPGVADAVRAQDATGTNELQGQDYLFSEEKVQCVGHIICGMLADTPEHARRAAAAVKITYENLEPVILTMEDAIKHNSYYLPEKKIRHGNADEAFKTADHIIEGEIHIRGQEQFYMETNTVLAVPKREENELDIYISTQDPTSAQLLAAIALGVPSNRIVSHVKRVGGAFGGKLTKPNIFACAAAVAAHKTKRPVRIVLERWEDMLITGGRHPFLGKYKVGCMNDGKIVGADITFYSNAGCTPDESVLVSVIALIKMDSAYSFPNLTCRATACKTNLPSNTGFRGFGFPQTALVVETIMDAVAMKCQLPPHQLSQIKTMRNSCITGLGWENALKCSSLFQNACEKLRQRLEPVIQQNPNGKWEEWVIGAFMQKIELSATGFFNGYNTFMDWETGEGDAGPYFIYGAACSEIELDCLTGGHKNLRTDIVMDVGFSMNPGIDMGQVEGAFTQGFGLFTIEELQYTSEGSLYTRGPDKYKIPAVCDVPTEFNISFLANSDNPYTIYSTKGLGETSLFLGCSMFFAIKDALDSARAERGLPKDFILNSPASSERIRMACADHLTNMIPRDEPGTYVPWSVDVSK
ncbi:aldehyde oxidase 1-like [Ascaphus truei]|uniref:aldehyde oxidase 1-like n=1 Tax=Ascaphus truei TaxID=8439 RepID=UPI003F59288A